MNAKNWVGKAVLPKGSKFKQRLRVLENKGLVTVFQGDGVLIGSDNHRIHFWHDDEIKAEPIAEIAYPVERVMKKIETGRKGIELCEFSTYALRKACTVALSLFKKQHANDYIDEGMRFIYVHIDEKRIKFCSNREEVGSMEFTLKDGDTFPLKTKTHDLFYSFRAEHPDHFYINPKYFKDALDGMGKSATLRKNGDLLYLKGESGAEAAVMPLAFESFIKYHEPYVILPVTDN